VTWLRPTAPAIGLSEEFLPRTECITLEHGDTLFLYTDGVTEAFNQVLEPFGSLRLAEVLKNNASLGAAELLQSVRRGLETFGDGHVQEDDTTYIALKVLE
jgi:sigma-B regulation protein RsbU (phosphoserine phosphatase)